MASCAKKLTFIPSFMRTFETLWKYVKDSLMTLNRVEMSPSGSSREVFNQWLTGQHG
jgi:hypothetical protein